MGRRVTLREIGRKAGVSGVAVGAALGLLSPKSKAKVSAEKAEEIRRVAHEMGFMPNHLARAFHRQETKTIGVLFRVLSNPTMVNHMLDEIHRALDRAGYGASLRPFTGRFERVEATVNELVGWRVDGLIFVNLFAWDAEEGGWARLSGGLKRLNVPYVTVECSVEPGSGGVDFSTDVEGAFAEVTGHLLGLGHRRIATLGIARSAANRRWAGVVRAVEGVVGASVEELLIPKVETGKRVQDQVMAIREVVPRILGMKERVTGVVCGNDIVAAGLMSALKDAGVDVPREMAVTGYDDSELAVICRPTLTTMAWPTEEIARTAVEVLLRRVKGEEDGEVRVFKARLVVGGSSGGGWRVSNLK